MANFTELKFTEVHTDILMPGTDGTSRAFTVFPGFPRRHRWRPANLFALYLINDCGGHRGSARDSAVTFFNWRLEGVKPSASIWFSGLTGPRFNCITLLRRINTGLINYL